MVPVSDVIEGCACRQSDVDVSKYCTIQGMEQLNRIHRLIA